MTSIYAMLYNDKNSFIIITMEKIHAPTCINNILTD